MSNPTDKSKWEIASQCSVQGMTLRDEFASRALQGLLASGAYNCKPSGRDHDAAARIARIAADFLLMELYPEGEK